MGILALTSLLVAGTGAYLISRILPNLSPGQKRLQQDIKALREQLDNKRSQLIPLEGGELELLSDQSIDQKESRGFKKIKQGTFTTIYGEPVLLYAFRKYVSGPDGLIVSYTQTHEIIFWIRTKGSRLVIDNDFVGELDAEGNLRERPKGKKVLASLRGQENGMDVIVVGEREIATLAPSKAGKSSNLQHRVFELVVNDLTAEEKQLLWALTLYKLVTEDQ